MIDYGYFCLVNTHSIIDLFIALATSVFRVDGYPDVEDIDLESFQKKNLDISASYKGKSFHQDFKQWRTVTRDVDGFLFFVHVKTFFSL